MDKKIIQRLYRIEEALGARQPSSELSLELQEAVNRVLARVDRDENRANAEHQKDNHTPEDKIHRCSEQSPELSEAIERICKRIPDLEKDKLKEVSTDARTGK